MKKRFYVYVYLDPRKPGSFYYGHWKFNHEPMYVGKGCDSRCYSHLVESHNIVLRRKISRIRSEGLEPIVLLKRKHLTELQSLKLETALILKIGRVNLKTGPLVNMVDRSEGNSNRVISKKTLELQRLAGIRVMKKMSEEAKVLRASKISKSLIQAYASGKRNTVTTGKAISKTKLAKGSFYKRMSPKKRKAYSEVRSKIATAIIKRIKADPKKDALFRKRLSVASKKGHKNMTKKVRAGRAEKCRQAALRQHANMTPEQKQLRIISIKRGMKNV